MRHLACAALIAASLAVPAMAQKAAPPPATAQDAEQPEQEIVVTGNRNVEEQVRNFVGALAPSSPRGQLGRFDHEVCPSAIGVTAGQKAAIEKRLRQVAAGAGIPVGKTGCSPNAILIVAMEKGPFLQGLMRARPEYFGAMSSAQFRRLSRAPGPTASWQLEYKVDARGVPIPQGGIQPHVNKTIHSGSRITAADRPVFEAAALIVEQGALDGLSTTQLADYAAMRLFAKTDPQRLAGSSAPTILGILDAPMGSAVPLTLTDWDLSFLRGLYASADNLYAGAQRSTITRQITTDMQRRDTADQAPPAAKKAPPPPR